MKLSVLSSIINLRNNIKLQNDFITNKFDELSNYSIHYNEAIRLGFKQSELAGYINKNIKNNLNNIREQAIGEWCKNNPIYGHIKSTSSIRDSIIKKTNYTVPFLNEKELLQSWDVYHWFKNDSNTLDYTPTCYPMKRDTTEIPCMKMKVIYKREIGIKKTYDITVHNTHNFAANGVIVHNCDFAVLLYKYIVQKLTESEIHEIVKDAVEIEQDFICDSLPCRLIGMNQDLMCQYIRYVADRLLLQFGYKRIYNTTNPFPFMDTISLEGKTNFFEQRVTEYVMSSSCKQELSFNMSTLDSDDF